MPGSGYETDTPISEGSTGVEALRNTIDLARHGFAMDDVIVLSEWLDTPDGACCKLLGTIAPDEAIHGPGAGIAIRKGEDELRELALASENVQRALDGRGIRTVIVRAPKLVNIVPA